MENKKSKTPIIITSIVLIIVVAIVLVFVLRPKEETPIITGDGDTTNEVVEESSTEEGKPSDSNTIKTETGSLISVTVDTPTTVLSSGILVSMIVIYI